MKILIHSLVDLQELQQILIFLSNDVKSLALSKDTIYDFWIIEYKTTKICIIINASFYMLCFSQTANFNFHNIN